MKLRQGGRVPVPQCVISNQKESNAIGNLVSLFHPGVPSEFSRATLAKRLKMSSNLPKMFKL